MRFWNGFRRVIVIGVLPLVTVTLVRAQQHTSGTPDLLSRSGAAYTMYTNFSGFSFSGIWGGADNNAGTPGVTASHQNVSDSGAFNATQQAQIKRIWARIAEAYAPFNVNVTTIDPAIAAGQASSDFNRQKYYDATARMMHTVIGGGGGWSGGGGVSFVGTASSSYNTSPNAGAGRGYHTNWVFSAQAPNNDQFIATATSHEDGHGLNLNHQGDHFGSNDNEYSTNGGATGNGSYSPIMGNPYSSQRSTWRVGTYRTGIVQNDVAQLLTNGGLTVIDDGIGRTLNTATALSLSGTSVDFSKAKGVIVPSNTAAPTPMGVDNYTKGVFKFFTTGAGITLKLTNGSQYITPGAADPGATLRSVLKIYDANGSLVGVGSEDASTLFSTYTGTLGAGAYFAEISSIGGYQSTFDSSAQYYTMGSYFLSGSGGFTPVPEPASMAAIFTGLGYLAARRRRRSSK